MDFFALPFGIVFKHISHILTLVFQSDVANYALTIIFFTLFVKILLFPLSLKQQLSTLKTQALQPELDALKRAYGNDNQAMMQEQQKLYAKYNVNPLSGCLPTLIMFPVIIIVYSIIRSPLTYIAGISSDALTKLAEIAEGFDATKTIDQLALNSYFLKLDAGSPVLEQANEIMAGKSFVNMHFLGLDLGTSPNVVFTGFEWSWAVLGLLLIPLLTLGTQYLLQWYSSPTRGKKKDKNADPTARGMNVMMKLMPLLTFVIAFTFPSGLGFYWIISNLFSLLQTFLINTFFIKKNEKEVI